MRTRHPDVDAAATTPTSSEVLGIMRAFSVLKDPKKRADYDRGGQGRTRRPGREGSGREATGRETSGQDGARGQPVGERRVRRMPQDIPVRRVPRDVPPHTNAEPAPPFRVTPVRWEQGPWTGHGEVKRRRTT
jgi:curved DNA-binding protein CbpA